MRICPLPFTPLSNPLAAQGRGRANSPAHWIQSQKGTKGCVDKALHEDSHHAGRCALAGGHSRAS